MAFVNNAIEIRTDALKMLIENNRPPYRGASNIGVWYSILEVLSIVGVITNCGLIAFSHHTLQFIVDEPYIIVIIALAIEHVVLLLKFIIAFLIPDVPAYVATEYAKQEFIEEEVCFHSYIPLMCVLINLSTFNCTGCEKNEEKISCFKGDIED
jgi:hypothetical protein